MSLHDMKCEISAARRTLESADEVATSMAEILRGRLRKVRPWYLKQLKKELQNFNAHTQEWKD